MPTRVGIDLAAGYMLYTWGDVFAWGFQFGKQHLGTTSTEWWTESEARGGFIAIDNGSFTKVDPRVGVPEHSAAGSEASWDLVVDLEPGEHLIRVSATGFREGAVGYSVFVQPL